MRERLHNSVKKYFRTKLSLSGMQNLTGSILSRYVRTSFMPQTSLGEGSQPDSKWLEIEHSVSQAFPDERAT